MNALAPVKEAEPLHNLAWWAAETERTGTDWRGVLLTVLRGLNVIAPCDVCEREPCLTPSFCRLCREADAKPVQWQQRTKTATQRPTPEATIEAIKQVIRDFGLAALEQPSTKDRVLQCDADARNRLDNWISDFKKRNSG
jgi:hypothetical protein